MFLVSSCSCLRSIHWSQVLSWEWRCSWSSADRRCSNYIWVINNFIAYLGATYIRGFTALNSLLPGRYGYDFTCLYSKHNWYHEYSGNLSLEWMPEHLVDGKSTLTPSHYLSQCWLRLMSPYGITGPWWVEEQHTGCAWHTTVHLENYDPQASSTMLAMMWIHRNSQKTLFNLRVNCLLLLPYLWYNITSDHTMESQQSLARQDFFTQKNNNCMTKFLQGWWCPLVNLLRPSDGRWRDGGHFVLA